MSNECDATTSSAGKSLWCSRSCARQPERTQAKTNVQETCDMKLDQPLGKKHSASWKQTPSCSCVQDHVNVCVLSCVRAARDGVLPCSATGRWKPPCHQSIIHEMEAAYVSQCATKEGKHGRQRRLDRCSMKHVCAFAVRGEVRAWQVSSRTSHAANRIACAWKHKVPQGFANTVVSY